MSDALFGGKIFGHTYSTTILLSPLILSYAFPHLAESIPQVIFLFISLYPGAVGYDIQRCI